MAYRTFLLSICFFLLGGCESIALVTTPAKKPQVSHTRLAKVAEEKFWKTLHQGDYGRLPETTSLLTAAYLENPHDPRLAAHLGFVHIWKIAERARKKEIPPTITNEIILAKHYFQEAVQLEPSDPRSQGFLGDALLVSGQIFDDEREQVRGYFQLQHAIVMWPEFNYFTAGYPMSTLTPDSEHFKEGLAWQWATLDLCAQHRVSRTNPDFKPYMHLETTKGKKRACWNSWIAPHNFEGFFLNMGDMLVKSGDWQTAIKIYKNARLSRTYRAWPYRKMLEERILHAKENVRYFQKEQVHTPARTVLFNSGYGCVACHQR